jgi:peroxidase
LFAQHEIVTAEGIPCESLWPGDVALSGFGAAARNGIPTLFPALAARTRPQLARAVLRRAEAVALRAGPADPASVVDTVA